MGESIAEGTIVRWIKKIGETVERDEPLFEISTDKVDAEVPSPVAGVLVDIRVHEGETVSVNSIVATIGSAEEADGTDEPATQSSAGVGPGHTGSSAAAQPPPEPAGTPIESTSARDTNADQAPRRRHSPLVRRLAREHNVNLEEIDGSGVEGRVTRDDVLRHIEASRGAESPVPSPESRADVRPMSVMRRKIAEHMVLSQRTAAHVHSVFHVDFSTVARIRREKKAEYARMGARLTYTAFVAKVAAGVIGRHPVINASLDGTNVIYKKDINIGIAVALDDGLIVPVIQHADAKSLLELSQAIADLGDRAKARQLKPDEVQGGTFTITNPGQFGAQFGMPIVNQPQVAILGMGTIEKRPVVVDDAVVVRTMAYLTLGFDHRLIDGAVADQFMADIKRGLERFDPEKSS
jgi:2-oxoglutarate dehydrogenase E2 component (dihydrolipoamide succinyltransferase)